jgi:hypothetical protein
MDWVGPETGLDAVEKIKSLRLARNRTPIPLLSSP